jgi:hypothetical protein
VIRIAVAAFIFVSAFPPFVSNANQTADCAVDYGRFGKISTNREDAEAMLSVVAKRQLQIEQNVFSDLVKVDIGSTVSISGAPSAATIDAARSMLKYAQRDLTSRGYNVRFEQRAGAKVRSGMVEYQIPARDVLIISNGKASGEAAREMKRFAKYADERMQDPNVRALDDAPFAISIDPLLTEFQGSAAYFSADRDLGRGITIRPSLLTSRIDKFVDVLRHEFRHMKAYFDLASNKATVNRAEIIDKSPEGMPGRSLYRNGFSVEEVDAFESQARTAQQAMGKLTEKMRKAMAGSEKPSPSEIAGYQKDIEWLNQRGLSYLDTASTLNTSTAQYAKQARELTEDWLIPDEKFAERIVIHSTTTLPHLRAVVIRLEQDLAKPGAQIQILIPTKTATEGTQAIREYATAYFVELEAQTAKAQKRLRERRSDLDREALSRLSLKPEKALKPAAR